LAHARLAVPGGEDAEFFRIDGRAFVATASLRSGSGPYDMQALSTIFELSGDRFEPFLIVPTTAAKQWKHFEIDGRHFLALAQGATGAGESPAPSSQSCIFEWDGASFRPFQRIESAWGYNWAFFEVGGERLLAYADHVAPSCILRWNGSRFEQFQQLEGRSGRAFCFFEAGGASWLAFANLLHDSLWLRWSDGAFRPHQTLSGPGGREFLWLPQEQRLLQVNFLLGTRDAPQPELESTFHRLHGQAMVIDERFATSGATDACSFEDDGRVFLVVANSLSGQIRFRTPSRVYRLAGKAA